MAREDELGVMPRRVMTLFLLVDTSEYRKLDGGLSCLSLRF